MGSFKDLCRFLNGFSLVARETAKRSQVLQAAQNGDFQTFITSSLKNAVLATTDIAGLTRGRVREFSKPLPPSEESIVYFTDSSNGPDASTHLPHQAALTEDVRPLSDVEASPASPIQPILSDSQALANEDLGAIAQSVSAPDSLERADTPVEQCCEPKACSLPSADGGRQIATTPPKRRRPRERRVPSTSFSRALGFAGLGAGLAWGTIQESAKRLVFGTRNSKDNHSAISPFLSEKNAERLALALCRMRGAALKIGQMMSIQDESIVPAPILAALEIVRQGADVMPKSQLNQVLDAELGHDWSSKLASFDYEPMAAASIGQVHRAVTKDGLQVAMKIQYPGVADSIESDIENVRLLLDYTNLIPKGLYLDRAMKVAKEELSRECDYDLEASNQKRFRDLLCNTEGFYVPLVVDDISSKRVLTTELVPGIPIDKLALLNQETRDYVGKKLLELTLKELFVFRFMQTDPNWSNFLYDVATKSINLIDFGAARDYPKSFVDDYLRMVLACANSNREAVIEMSRRLGFLSGMESDIMLEAHVQAGFVVGLPFSKPGGYDFGSTNITQSISNLGATMLKYRQTPPPDEAYSLHRKLSGAFLACIKLGAVVPCRELLLEVYEQYSFGEYSSKVTSSSSVS